MIHQNLYILEQKHLSAFYKLQLNIYPPTMIIILTILSLFIRATDCASSPLIYVRDNYMASYILGISFFSGTGIGNTTVTYGHSPDITPTSINYKLLISKSYNTDYTISSNTISISFQVSVKNQTFIYASLYSLYKQAFHGIYVQINVFVIDELSPSYPNILPSILRLNNFTLMSTSYDSLINVSTFSSVNLNLNNNLAIYSFITGFQIVSQNTIFQLTVSSQIINDTTIKVTISSLANLVSVDLVRIDTVVIDKTAITSSKLLTLDFQTIDCPTDPSVINYNPAYSYSYQNKFIGLSSFYLINQAHYSFNLMATSPTSIGIFIFPMYNFSRIVFAKLFFLMKQCPIGYPFFNIISQLCFDTNCSSNSYLDVSLQQCLQCFYACQTCENDINCTSCYSSSFRFLDNSSMCIPIDGYYDDGSNNSIAQQCNSPCGNCIGDADNCTSCISSAFFLDSIMMKCIPCSSTLSKCLSCIDSHTCTQTCLYFCETCDNLVNCTSCDSLIDFRVLDLNTSLCIPMNGYYDDGSNNSIAQQCNSPCGNCIGDADNCTSCISSAFFLDSIMMKCIPCSSTLSKCLSCADSVTCTQTCLYFCETCDNLVNCTSCDSLIDFRVLDLNTSLCIPMDGYYDDGTNNSIAQPCFYSCKTCDNGVNCTYCDSLIDFRVLDLNTSLCIPMNGYYDDGTNNSIAQQCNSPCGNCFGDANNCTSCINSFYYLELNSSACILCQQFNLGCLVCERQGSQILCLTCDLNSSFVMTNNSLCACSNNSFYHNSTSNCQICQDFISECLECSSQVRCTECSPYFYLYNSSNTTICQQICGDGVLFNLQCDDGNLINGDGCSSSCQIELFFSCSGGSSTSQSVCVYNGNIEITTISFLKDETKNTIYLRFQVNKNINISSINLNLMFLPNFPYQTIQTIYDASFDQYLCTINYDQSLNSYDRLTLTFRFPTDSNFSSSLNFTITLNSQTDNNLALKVYSSQMYSQLQSLTDSSEILIYLYTAVCLLSWIAGKQLYSLELFFIIQYAYLGLLTIDRLEFSMISLKQFGLTFGLIDMNNLRKSNNQFSFFQLNSLPIRIKSLGFSESLLININFSFVALLGIFLIGISIYFIGVKLELLRWRIQGKNMFIWWVFYWLIMLQIPVMVSAFISFKCQKSSSSNFAADFSISILYLILFTGICTYLLIFKNTRQQVNPENLKSQSSQLAFSSIQNKESLRDKKYTLAKPMEDYFSTKQEKTQNYQLFIFFINNFYLCVMIYRTLIILAVIFFNDNVGSNVFCLILSALKLVYISEVRPYKFNFRPIFNSSTVLVLSVLYTFQKIITKQPDETFFSFDAVVFLIFLLYLTLVINTYFIVKEMFQNIVNYFEFSQKKVLNSNLKNKIIENESIQDLILQQKEVKNNNNNFSNISLKQEQEDFQAFKIQIQNVTKIQASYQRKKRRSQLINQFLNKNQQNNLITQTQAIKMKNQIKYLQNSQINFQNSQINLQNSLINQNLENFMISQINLDKKFKIQDIGNIQFQCKQIPKKLEIQQFQFKFEEQQENAYQKPRPRREKRKKVQKNYLINKKEENINLQTIKVQSKNQI